VEEEEATVIATRIVGIAENAAVAATAVATSTPLVPATATAKIATAESVVVEASVAAEATVVAATTGRRGARQLSATVAMRHLQHVTRPRASTPATVVPTIEVAKEDVTLA